MPKEDNYKNREIDTMFNGVHEKLDEISVDVKEIKVQTLKTNGRVNKHDIWFKVLWTTVGICGTCVTLFVPLYMSNVKDQKAEFTDLQNDIHAIKQTLLNYDFEITP